jgi:hypothetical protein
MKTSIYTLVTAASLALIAAVSFTPTPAAACTRCAGKLFCGTDHLPIGCLNDITANKCCKVHGVKTCPCPKHPC